jgi:hypothetical protein
MTIAIPDTSVIETAPRLRGAIEAAAALGDADSACDADAAAEAGASDDGAEVAVGGDGHVGRIGEFKLLRRGRRLFHVADGVEDFALHVGLVDAGADLRRTLGAAGDVFRPIKIFRVAFFV